MKSSKTIFARIAVSALLVATTTLVEALVVVRPPLSRGIPKGSFAAMVTPSRTRNQPLRINADAMALRSAPGENDSDESIGEKIDQDESSKASLLDKINNFLDTPILDANNRSDQGAFAEALKKFVRDESEIAQVAFSVVVVAIMVLVTRFVLSL